MYLLKCGAVSFGPFRGVLSAAKWAEDHGYGDSNIVIERVGGFPNYINETPEQQAEKYDGIL